MICIAASIFSRIVLQIVLKFVEILVFDKTIRQMKSVECWEGGDDFVDHVETFIGVLRLHPGPRDFNMRNVTKTSQQLDTLIRDLSRQF
jgi:hypothetical protein